MRRSLGTCLLGLLLVCAPALRAAEKAICPVCSLTQGETHPEPVKAVRVHDGKEHGFCSEKCAVEFDKDPGAYRAPSFPRPAPDFAVADLGGKRLSKEALEGKVILVDFWATWCAPCVKAMPKLQALHQKYSGRGFTVLGISIDEDGPAAVEKLIAQKKVTYPIAMDSKDSPAWDAFRVKVVPSAYLLDRQGRIVAQWTGAAADPKEIETKLTDLLAE